MSSKKLQEKNHQRRTIIENVPNKNDINRVLSLYKSV